MAGVVQDGVGPRRSMFDKIWDRHVIVARESGPSLIYIDRDIIHEGSFHAFADMRRKGLAVRRPGQVFGVADHYVPTTGRSMADAATPQIATAPPDSTPKIQPSFSLLANATPSRIVVATPTTTMATGTTPRLAI